MIYRDGRKVISRQRAVRGAENGRTDCVYIVSNNAGVIYINQVLVDKTVEDDKFILPHFDEVSVTDIASSIRNYKTHSALISSTDAFDTLNNRIGTYMEVAFNDQMEIENYMAGDVIIDKGAFRGFKKVNLLITGKYSTKICSGAFDEDAEVTIKTWEGMERMIVFHTDKSSAEKYMLVAQKELLGLQLNSSSTERWEVKPVNFNEAGIFTR